MKDAKKHWQDKANKMLVGKKIVKVEWMGEVESDEIGWHSKPVCMQLDDGTWIFPMADDEGNDGGALAVGNAETLPVF